jgi:hypothetical protein
MVTVIFMKSVMEIALPVKKLSSKNWSNYQVSNHLAIWFQRRRFLEIDQSETRIAMFVNGRKHLWAVLYKKYSFHSNSINKHGHHR